MHINNHIKNIIINSSNQPGVYKFIDKNNKILYIGKAKNLKNRLLSYLQITSGRIAIMLQRSINLEYIITKTENEALILEAKFITSIKPEFNILLKDDFSMSYLQINIDHQFPGIKIVRNKIKNKNLLIGPFLSNKFLFNISHELVKLFKIRNCSDEYFKSRKKPCIQYFIQKCSAPCVNKISQKEYLENLNSLINVITGKNNKLLVDLNKKMLEESSLMNYENAAKIRDIILGIKELNLKYKSEFSIENGDIINFVEILDVIIFQVFIYRFNKFLGNKIFTFNKENLNFVNHNTHNNFEQYDVNCNQNNYNYISKNNIKDEKNIDKNKINNNQNILNNTNENNINYNQNKLILTSNIKEIYELILLQYYQINEVPNEIIIDQEFDFDPLLTALKQFNNKVIIFLPKRGDKLKALLFAKHNAEYNAKEHLKQKEIDNFKLQTIQRIFKLPIIPKRIEIYDNSHIMGKYPIGAMVVLIDGKFTKSEYRKYHIQLDKFGGDDCEMLKEVLTRRCKRIIKSNNAPDLIIVDGGKGQLSAALSVLKEFNFSIPVVAITKSEFRNKGNERFFLNLEDEPITLNNDDKIMQYLQLMRDEAHKLAIESHRKLRNKKTLNIKK